MIRRDNFHFEMTKFTVSVKCLMIIIDKVKIYKIIKSNFIFL